jgi:hypothetical protein
MAIRKANYKILIFDEHKKKCGYYLVKRGKITKKVINGRKVKYGKHN